MVYIDKEKLLALFKWYMQEVGDSLISVLVVGRDGLVIDILTRDSKEIEEKKFVGAFSSLVEVILKKLTQDFDLGTFGAGTFDTDKYRFIFCESGSDYVLVSILHPATFVDDVFPYTFLAADKVARIIDGELPVSPVIPKIKRDSEVEKLKRKLDYYQSKAHSPDYVYKLSLIGDGGVGKTSMVQRYVHGLFKADYKATIGTFISKKECEFKELNTSVKFMIWDLAGQHQFQRLWPDYLTDSRAGIIAFDLTNKESFENVRKWYDIINKVALPKIILILVGNKADLNDERQISTEEGMDLAKELGVYYMETSAKTNQNVGELFEWVALQILNNNIEEVKDTIFDKQIEEGSQFVISSPQLKLFNNFFTKQLDFCIGKSDTKDIIKYLDILKAIQKNKL
ncbi:MAG: GTP-binding protein [Candidatus Lokiarchaeota archaeon]|nr:GTP-binding protein [Candidatus Lokiarchaeota archaeon]